MDNSGNSIVEMFKNIAKKGFNNSENIEGDFTNPSYGQQGKSLLVFIVLLLGFRSSFFEPFKIPTGSMIPTLVAGDYVLVNKFAYGFFLPFSDWTFFEEPVYLTEQKHPKRGDVVVFKYPKNPKEFFYIKRMIGLPGDEVEIFDNDLYINGEKMVQTPAEKGPRLPRETMPGNIDLHYEQLGDVKHWVQFYNNRFGFSSFPKTVVPDDHYLVMGDNRDNSSDSRSWGFVHKKYLKGKALFIWFSFISPWNRADHTMEFNPLKWDYNKMFFRKKRIGTAIN